MYRKRFEPQICRLPQNYCGWAADGNTEIADEIEKSQCEEKGPQLPCPVKKECTCFGNELSDIILIGAIIAFLLFMKGEGKPDVSLLVPLTILLFTK